MTEEKFGFGEDRIYRFNLEIIGSVKNALKEIHEIKNLSDSKLCALIEHSNTNIYKFLSRQNPRIITLGTLHKWGESIDRIPYVVKDEQGSVLLPELVCEIRRGELCKADLESYSRAIDENYLEYRAFYNQPALSKKGRPLRSYQLIHFNEVVKNRGFSVSYFSHKYVDYYMKKNSLNHLNVSVQDSIRDLEKTLNEGTLTEAINIALGLRPITETLNSLYKKAEDRLDSERIRIKD